MSTGSDYLARALVACGLDHVFHMPLVLPNAIKAMQEVAAKVLSRGLDFSDTQSSNGRDQ